MRHQIYLTEEDIDKIINGETVYYRAFDNVRIEIQQEYFTDAAETAIERPKKVVVNDKFKPLFEEGGQ